MRIVIRKQDVDVATPILGRFHAEAQSDDTFIVSAGESRQIVQALAAGGVLPELVTGEVTSLERRFLDITGRAGQ